jgi:tetratricopeptide (TPR) repeat protein
MKQRLKLSLASALTLLLMIGALAQQPKKKFDHNPVRDDFFASIRGEPKRLYDALKKAEAGLKENPKDPEALVWHGQCLMQVASVDHFAKNDFGKGMELWGKGMAEMDQAVALRPKSPSVLVARGAYLLTAATFVPEGQRKDLLDRVVSDYETTYAVQKAGFAKLTKHSQGELLIGLAEVYLRLGDTKKARPYLERVQSCLKGTGWAKDAGKWLLWKPGLKPLPKRDCIGCHGD